MSQINWLRCNKCRLLMSSAIRNFFISQCGHIFCHECATAGGTVCQQCQAPDIRLLELKEPLPPVIADLHTPCIEFMEQMVMTAKFQLGQIAAVNKFVQNTDDKYSSLKRLYWEQRKTFMKLQQVREKMKTACDEWKAVRPNYQHILNAAGSNRRHGPPANFFGQDANVVNNFNRNQRAQRSNYQFTRQVAFVSPNNPYNSDNSNSSYVSNNLSSNMTPLSVHRMINNRRVPRSAGSSSTAATSNSSSLNINMF
ncbi:zip homologous protein 2-like [Microplitis mediator]|uniref:zip homologous protein 2-like n=1 Tax=Microplitis mediator TaxID=375433 RepID=UPI00255713A0|nr:zip homologous protein 2-like [Microplitis mediator]